MKNKLVAALLAFFLGGIGIHKFYLGKGGSGILYLLFCWTGIPALLAFIDFIVLLVCSDDEFNYKYNRAFMPANNAQPQQAPASKKDDNVL